MAPGTGLLISDAQHLPVLVLMTDARTLGSIPSLKENGPVSEILII